MAARAGTWSADVLAGLGVPNNTATATFLAIWHQAENPTATYNYLGTTMRVTGSKTHPGSSAGVQDYPSQAAGVEATVKTLKLPAYAGIVNAMKSTDIVAMARAVIASPWGTAPHPLLDLAGDSKGNADPQGITGGAATAIGGAVKDATLSVGDFLGKLTSPALWLRILYILAGAGLLVWGANRLTGGAVGDFAHSATATAATAALA